VIRCVRFASRFGYDLVSELAAAAKDHEIQVAVSSP
jgi:tRNA nucleotidyltransferase (CCA-adding enzyme)